MACRPGEVRISSSRPLAAGSRAMAASTSSRAWARAEPIALPDKGIASVHQTLEEDRGQVALTEVGDDHDDRLAGALRAGRDLGGGCEGGAGGDPDEQALLGRGLAGPLDGRLGVDVDDLVVDLAVEDLGDEVGAEALDLVAGGRTPVEDRRLGRLHRDDLDVGLAALEDLADAGDRAAGTDPGHDDVDLAVGVLPDLLGRGLAVDLGVRRVGELAGQ